jgi:hypothetical protein
MNFTDEELDKLEEILSCRHPTETEIEQLMDQARCANRLQRDYDGLVEKLESWKDQYDA